MAKRGRRPAHYKTKDGDVVLGLARRPSDGRWRIIGTGITFTQPDEKLAIHRFRQWQRLQSKEVVTFKRFMPHGEVDGDVRFEERADGFNEFVIDLDGNVVPQAEVPADVVWSTLRDFILSKPLLAAQKLGIPEVAYLKDMPPPGPSPPLKRSVGFISTKRVSSPTSDESPGCSGMNSSASCASRLFANSPPSGSRPIMIL